LRHLARGADRGNYIYFSSEPDPNKDNTKMKKQTNPTIKAHLIRSAFYLLLLLAVCAIPIALAQSRTRGTAKQSVVNPTVSSSRATGIPKAPILPVPKFPAAVLYDQLNNPGTLSTSSQDFEAAYNTSDDFTADDFVVPGGQTWNITEVDAQGVYASSGGPAVSFNVFFYQNNGGLPGTSVYTATGQSYVNNSGVFQITLNTPAVLTSGTYWVSVQARMDFSPNGQWYWTDRTVQTNSPATWQNPGGGFGFCPAWAVRTGCVGDASAPDQMFRLIGTVGGGGCTAAVRYDFNGDGYPDFVLYNESTRQTQMMYLNNNVPIGTAFGPTLPGHWSLIDEADFNGDSHPDYLLYNSSTGQTAIVYMNDNVVTGVALGPTLPHGWLLIAAGDFNGDCEPDYVVYNSASHVTFIVYMNNNVVVGAAVGPTIPTGWELVGLADFNGDGHIDYLLSNPTTGQSEILYLNNNVVIGSAFGPTIPRGWKLEGTADFNRDGKPDYLIYYHHVTVIAYMNNNNVVGVAVGPALPNGWLLNEDSDARCDFRLTPTGANALQGGGFGSFVVGCDYSTCEWSAFSDVPWITLIGTTHYFGPNTITYSVAANGGDARDGTISVNNELVFTVHQAGTGTTSCVAGTWVGTVTGTYSYSSCPSWTGITNFSMVVTQNGTNISGSAEYDGAPCFNVQTCAINDFPSTTGNVTGTANCPTVNVSYSGTVNGGLCSGQGFSETFTLTLNGNTLSGTGSGNHTITLTKQP
jgi:VCBS repeat protein